MKGSTLKKIQPNRKERKKLRHKWKKETLEAKKKMIEGVLNEKSKICVDEKNE